MDIIYIWCVWMYWFLGTSPTVTWFNRDAVVENWGWWREAASVSDTVLRYLMFKHFKQIWGETKVAQSTWQFLMSLSDLSCQVRWTRCWTRGGWWRACHTSCWTSLWVWLAGVCAPPRQSSRPSEQSPASAWSNSDGSLPLVLHAHTQSAGVTLHNSILCISFTSVCHAAAFLLHLLLHLLQLLTDLKHKKKLVGWATMCHSQTARYELQLQHASSNKWQNILQKLSLSSCSLCFIRRRWGRSSLTWVFLHLLQWLQEQL